MPKKLVIVHFVHIVLILNVEPYIRFHMHDDAIVVYKISVQKEIYVLMQIMYAINMSPKFKLFDSNLFNVNLN